MLKLSIITINYNNLEGLKRTVESVLNQTWQEFEYIVIDGDSSDGSAIYLESQSDNIDYWISEPDKGIYNAMNKGIIHAKGEYLLFLNSGDYFFANGVLESGNSCFNTFDIIYFNLNFKDNLKLFVVSYPEQLEFSHFIKDTLPHPASLIRKSLFETVGLYDENLKIVSDWKFFILCVCKYNSTYFKINEILTTFCMDGMSSDPNNLDLILAERESVLKSDFGTFMNDYKELNKLKAVFSSFKKSRKLKLLVALGLINEF
jgi:glycosyltransferase involved in cell wall biosynthesis